ncbi:hypothetical protein [Nodularia sp. LEGE 04288]|uniref:hypothetical protein n=1 Tax=Nodularia sp. LEGE 04288 TaxID=1828639 RepID=UPI001D127FCC|nr:hypothetical protein [Nodularia sp. LEGE 04288]MCC2691572.1 hypothetical protein [Nodularia sp. LEGE 04288]
MRNEIFRASDRLDFAAKVNLGSTSRRLDRAMGIRVGSVSAGLSPASGDGAERSRVPVFDRSIVYFL